MTVALMGLDGAGKSTQAELLLRHAATRGDRSVIVHHSSTKVPGIANLKRRVHTRAIGVLKRGRAHIDIGSRDGIVSGGGTGLSWIVSTYIVLGSFIKSAWYRWRFRTPFVILDRCFLDDVVKVHWRFGCQLPASRAVLRIVPKPDVVIVLQGNATTTFERKKAINCTYVEYLRKEQILQQWLSEAARQGWNIRGVGIDGKQIGEVHQAVVRILDELAEYGSDGANRGKFEVSEDGSEA